MAAKYVVRLTPEERSELSALVRKGKTQADRIKHANILLAVDADGPAWTNEQTAKAFHCHANTVTNLRQRFVEGGLEAALERKKQQHHGSAAAGPTKGSAVPGGPHGQAGGQGPSNWSQSTSSRSLVESVTAAAPASRSSAAE